MTAVVSPFVVDLGVIAGVIVAVGAAISIMYRGTRNFAHRLAEEFEQRVKLQVAPLLAEFEPNHGTSTRDAIDRIEWRLEKVEVAVLAAAALAADVKHDLDISHQRADRVPPTAKAGAAADAAVTRPSP